jgi:hypothetical protein
MQRLNPKDNFEASLKYLGTIGTSLKQIKNLHNKIINDNNSHTFSFSK